MNWILTRALVLFLFVCCSHRASGLCLRTGKRARQCLQNNVQKAICHPFGRSAAAVAAASFFGEKSNSKQTYHMRRGVCMCGRVTLVSAGSTCISPYFRQTNYSRTKRRWHAHAYWHTAHTRSESESRITQKQTIKWATQQEQWTMENEISTEQLRCMLDAMLRTNPLVFRSKTN